MRRLLVFAFVAACGGAPSTTEPPAPEPLIPAPPQPENLEAALLAKGPPDGPSPIASAFVQVATELGVGVVRCPLAGGGTATARYGTPRDQVTRIGPMMLLEVDPQTEPPWDLVFDTVVAEGEWLSILAVPGATKGWVATRKRVLEFEHPPVKPGETVVCTTVATIPMRAVEGRVDLAGVSGKAYPVPCDPDPLSVASDGTFVTDVYAPCTLWVEAENRRSEKVRVDPGDQPLEVSFVLGPPDAFQGPDRSYTPAGVAMAKEHLAKVTARHDATVALVDRVGAALGDPGAKRIVDRWKYDLWEWKARIDAARNALDRPKPRTPKEGDH